MKHFFGCAAMLFLLAASTACKKTDQTIAPAPTAATITITSPSEGQTFRAGDTVHVRATVQYSGEMHGWKADITDSAGSTVRWTTGEVRAHSDRFDVDEVWIPTGTQAGTARLRLRTAVSHGGQGAEKDVLFRVVL